MTSQVSPSRFHRYSSAPSCYKRVALKQVVLATAGYDHTVRFWEATSGICYRTLQHADSQASCSPLCRGDEANVGAQGCP